MFERSSGPTFSPIVLWLDLRISPEYSEIIHFIVYTSWCNFLAPLLNSHSDKSSICINSLNSWPNPALSWFTWCFCHVASLSHAPILSQILTLTHISLCAFDLPLTLAREPENVFILRQMWNFFQRPWVIMGVLLFISRKYSWYTGLLKREVTYLSPVIWSSLNSSYRCG